MILFWILQSLLNIVLVGLAVSYIFQKRRLLRLEGQLQRALNTLSSGTVEKINTPLGSATSTLSERRASDPEDRATAAQSSSPSLNPATRYALAQKLIGQGLSLHDVARKSGISEAELGLLRKISNSPKNYEAH
jgi:hypothetical protein